MRDGLIDFVQVRGGSTRVLQRIGPAPALLQQITGVPANSEVRFTYRSAPQVHTASMRPFPSKTPCARALRPVSARSELRRTYPAEALPEDGFQPKALQLHEEAGSMSRGRGWLGVRWRQRSSR